MGLVPSRQTALVSVFVALSAILGAGAPALAAGGATAGRGSATASPTPASAPASASTQLALRDAIWQLERSLRHRLDLAERGDAVAAGRATANLVDFDTRLGALRTAALRLGPSDGRDLSRKVSSLGHLLDTLEREGRSTSEARRATSPWSAHPSAARLDGAAASTCETAPKVGDGWFATELPVRAGAAGDLWLRYTSPARGIAVVDTAASDFDTTVEVYSTCAAGGRAPIARGDDEVGLQARVSFPTAAGATTWIRLSGWDGAAGAAVIHLASGTGGFVGFVTDAATGQPVDRGVEIFDAAGGFVTGTDSEFGGGAYLVGGLTPGSYFAATRRFGSPDGLLDELYDDRPCAWGAPGGCDPTTGTAIPVQAGTITTGIDFALGQGATVAGHVRDATTGLGLSGVEVDVYGPTGSLAGETFTDDVGRFSAGGLAGGVFFAIAGDGYGSVYRRELYDDLPCQNGCVVTGGTPISVESGQTTSGVDFSLERLGAIAGTVSRTLDASPIAFAEVRIWDSQAQFQSYAFTDSSGHYAAGGLLPGTYFAATDTGGTFSDELYDDIPCASGCDPTTGAAIAVAFATTTPGIDFSLQEMGRISGSVIDSVTADPVASALVSVFDSSGSLVNSSFTTSGGTYVVDRLPAGTYHATASATNHQTELYDGIPCPPGCDPTTGTPFVVTLDGETPGIDFALTPLGSISGTILDAATSAPLDDVMVQVWSFLGLHQGCGLQRRRELHHRGPTGRDLLRDRR